MKKFLFLSFIGEYGTCQTSPLSNVSLASTNLPSYAGPQFTFSRGSNVPSGKPPAPNSSCNSGRNATSENSSDVLYVTFNFPLPFLVVTTTTPFIACEPYKAADADPFNTVILAISSGLILSIAFLGEIAPSITINASLFPKIDLEPLKVIFVLGLTPLLFTFNCKPETLPVKEEAALTDLVLVNCSPLTLTTEEVISLGFLLIPIAVTITSSKILASSSKVVLMLLELPTVLLIVL